MFIELTAGDQKMIVNSRHLIRVTPFEDGQSHINLFRGSCRLNNCQ